MGIKTELAKLLFARDAHQQSKLFSFNMTNKKRQAFLLVFASTLIVSCSSSNKSTSVVKKTKQEQTVSVEQQIDKTPEYYIEQAQVGDAEQAINNLTQAAALYVQEGNYSKALWLAEKTTSLILSKQAVAAPNNEQNNDAQTMADLLLIKSQVLVNIEEYDRAKQQLERIDDLQKSDGVTFNHTYYQLLAATTAAQSRLIDSIDAKMRAFALAPEANEADIFQLWQDLGTLEKWQLTQLTKQAPPYIAGWAALLNTAHQYGADPLTFSQELAQWQRQYSSHPAQAILPQITDNNAAEQQTTEHIAVLLPLSGKQQSAGIAAQQGILAAFGNNDEKRLTFIDTNSLDMSTLNEQLSQLNANFIIGPLLKSNVDSFLLQQEITLPTLLLNVPKTALLPHQVAFSMRPEDEAIQAASLLSNKSFKHPLVLSHKDSVSNRITKSFVDQWFKSTGTKPEVVRFERGQTMQKEVTTSLGVTQSKGRIKEIETRLKQTIKTESRSRRDIDMIYLVGSTKESNLVKAYIDVNISPFSDLIPVYASSRSHKASQDSSENNDLAGLVFTEIPWLLNSPQQNKEVAQQAKTLWPQRSDGLHRIFAMGFDSFNLIDKLAMMQKYPYIRHEGQTGSLNLTDNVLRRSLLWGRYTQGRVEHIDME